MVRRQEGNDEATSQVGLRPSVFSVGFLAKEAQGQMSPRPTGGSRTETWQLDKALGRRWRLAACWLGLHQVQARLRNICRWPCEAVGNPNLARTSARHAQALVRHPPRLRLHRPRCRPCPAVCPRPGPAPPHVLACRPSAPPPGVCVPAVPAPPAS